MHYNDHEKKGSPFIHANVPFVTLFVLDYMHLVCLGVMKRILKFLKNGPAICHPSQVQQSLISNDLIEMKQFVPSDFSRKPRSLIEHDRWKATEFRQFLLYTGPVVLKKILSSAMYSHFLTVRMGVAILMDSDNAERNSRIQYAKNVLKYFVENSYQYYGNTSMFIMFLISFTLQMMQGD